MKLGRALGGCGEEEKCPRSKGPPVQSESRGKASQECWAGGRGGRPGAEKKAP